MLARTSSLFGAQTRGSNTRRVPPEPNQPCLCPCLHCYAFDECMPTQACRVSSHARSFVAMQIQVSNPCSRNTTC